MRPNHQNNKRMRGRNRGGKGPNPLSRTYESNGPDVKIRGTAQHIAEKYLQLARDAQASGDPVSGESYLQHAEHYLRIIAAAQEQFRQQNPNYRFDTPGQDEGDEDGDEMPSYANGGPQPEARFPLDQDSDFQPRQQQPRQDYQQQPREPREPREWQPREQREGRGEWQPREGQQPREPREPREWQPREPRENRGDWQPREQREPRGDWQPREGQQRRDDRFPRRGPRQDFRQDAGGDSQPGFPEARGGEQPRQEQPRQEQARQEQPRQEQPRYEQPRAEQQPRQERPPRGERPPRFERAPAAEEPATGLPAFITAPVRTPVAEEPVEAAPAPAADGDEAGRFPLRQRRRRTPRARTEDGGDMPATGDVPVGE